MSKRKWKNRQNQHLAPSPEEYLASFSPSIQVLAHHVRALVKQALPDSTEQVKLGWKTIVLYVAGRVQPVYFGFIIPHTDYVTLGFTFGVLVDDPESLFLGAEEKLVRARYLTLRTPKDIRPALFTTMLQQAAEAARLPAPLRFELLSQARHRLRAGGH
jgi:hypothetical protein